MSQKFTKSPPRCQNATPPPPMSQCHSASPGVTTPLRLPRCHSATPPLQVTQRHSASPGDTAPLRLSRCNSTTPPLPVTQRHSASPGVTAPLRPRESCVPWRSLGNLFPSMSLKRINEYMAIVNGGYLCSKSLRVITAWLSLSQKTDYSVRLTSLPGCKVESALNSPSGWLLHCIGTYCF